MPDHQPSDPGRWHWPRPSITQALAIALALSLALSGYLLFRVNAYARTASIAEAGLALTHTPAADTDSVALSTPDMEAVLVQLQTLQGQLDAVSIQLEQKSLATRLLTPGSVAQPGLPLNGEDLPALLSEIELLYAKMQPLMVQLEIAAQSGRPASELTAMRDQMAASHQRLDDLLRRVEVAKSGTTLPTIPTPGLTSGLDGNGQSLRQEEYELVYQSLLLLQSMLQQMQVRNTPPASSVMPGTGMH